MDPFLQDIADARKRRSREYEKDLRLKITEAEKEISRLVTLFRTIDEDLKKVTLFGSLAENNVRSMNFDIDLVVESEKYLQLVSVSLDSSFEVDLLDWNTVPEHIKRRIREKGKVLYEA